MNMILQLLDDKFNIVNLTMLYFVGLVKIIFTFFISIAGYAEEIEKILTVVITFTVVIYNIIKIITFIKDRHKNKRDG